MPFQESPSAQVWSLGRQYADAAAALIDQNFVLPAAILAALSIEISVKAFDAKMDKRGKSKTRHGHQLEALFSKIAPDDQRALSAEYASRLAGADLLADLRGNEGIFERARYFYEQTAPFFVRSDTVYTAKALSEATLALGQAKYAVARPASSA